MERAPNNLTRPTADGPAWLDDVRQQVESLRFGSVEIVIHDGHVVQLERRERTRLERPSSADAAG
ncbi:MAG: YezD family protein [Verrucomicrobiales bacterium]|nr:YezD family protein [Verrucomicrobiales bacterium]